MRSVENIYLGKYVTDGIGIEDFVRKYNRSLDVEIKTKINSAISSLAAITDPFGQAIATQPTLIQNAINEITDLQTIIDEKLLPLVRLNVK